MRGHFALYGNGIFQLVHMIIAFLDQPHPQGLMGFPIFRLELPTFTRAVLTPLGGWEFVVEFAAVLTADIFYENHSVNGP